MKNILQKQKGKEELRLTTTSSLFATNSDNNRPIYKKEFMLWYISITSLKAQQSENILDIKKPTLLIYNINFNINGDIAHYC